MPAFWLATMHNGIRPHLNLTVYSPLSPDCIRPKEGKQPPLPSDSALVISYREGYKGPRATQLAGSHGAIRGINVC